MLNKIKASSADLNSPTTNHPSSRNIKINPTSSNTFDELKDYKIKESSYLNVSKMRLKLNNSILVPAVCESCRRTKDELLPDGLTFELSYKGCSQMKRE